MKGEKKIGNLVSVSGDKRKAKKLGKVYLMQFYWFEKEIGSLEFKGEKLCFKGDVNKSAKILFDRLKEFVEQYVQDRLVSERRAIYSSKLLDKLNRISARFIRHYDIIKDIVKSLANLTDKDHDLIMRLTRLTEDIATEVIEQKREAKHGEEHPSEG